MCQSAGSSSASRQTYVSGNAVLRRASRRWRNMTQALRAEEGERIVKVEVTFHAREAVPTSDYDPETGQCDPHHQLQLWHSGGPG